MIDGRRLVQGEQAQEQGSVTLRASVRGRVQGVGYRQFVRDTAAALGLRGFVENRPDGTVYLAASGRRPALELLLARLKEGPRMAWVESVQAEWDNSPMESLPRYFEIRI